MTPINSFTRFTARLCALVQHGLHPDRAFQTLERVLRKAENKPHLAETSLVSRVRVLTDNVRMAGTIDPEMLFHMLGRDIAE